MNALLTRSQKVISIQLMLIFVLIVAHVPRFARLTQFRLPNKNGQHKNFSPSFSSGGLFFCPTCMFSGRLNENCAGYPERKLLTEILMSSEMTVLIDTARVKYSRKQTHRPAHPLIFGPLPFPRPFPCILHTPASSALDFLLLS